MAARVIRRGAGRRGFTLVELLVALAIVGILASIAVPAYQDQMRKGRRSDAMTTLMDFANRQEQFMLDNSRYTSDLAALGMTSGGATPEGYYTLRVAGATADCPITSCYSLEATPVAGKSQAKDSDCQSFTMNSNGVRGATDAGSKDTTAECW